MAGFRRRGSTLSRGRILITGAGGYIGHRLARELLATTDSDLILWLHENGRPPVDQRSVAALHTLVETKRVRLAGGDLGGDDPFRSIDARSITGIVHAAAVTRFNVDPETAQRINVDGTRRVLHLAERCPSLESFNMLSTVYAAGLRQGQVREEPLDEASAFANEYERSKWRAESLVQESGSVPWRIFRIATIIADDDQGRVIQQNAVHNTLKLLYYGLLPLVPGDPGVPLYFVTGDFVTTAIRTMMSPDVPSGTIAHVCHRRDESVTLDQFISRVFDCFQLDSTFLGRRALKPLYVNGESFDLMVQEVARFSSGILGQAVGSLAPFARQLSSAKTFANDTLRKFLPAYAAPDPIQLVSRTCEDLLATRFGMNPSAVAVPSPVQP